jgi:hypothetical protein
MSEFLFGLVLGCILAVASMAVYVGDMVDEQVECLATQQEKADYHKLTLVKYCRNLHYS